MPRWQENGTASTTNEALWNGTSHPPNTTEAFIDPGQQELIRDCIALCCRWKYGVLSFKGVAELDNKEWFEQLPFIVAVSVMAGVMGALFNIVHKWMFRVGACLLSYLGRNPSQASQWASLPCQCSSAAV